MSQQANRPLSPHIQIYRWQIAMLTSIAHRASGIVLSLGSIFLAVWLISAASGPDAFASVNGFAASWFGQLLMFGWSFALFYHLCNGIRHLVWDVGIGLDLETARMTGYVAIGVAAALTLFVWIWAFIA
ncbi:Succinate dehydrogenase subunit C protein [Salinisphaera shabanensis E1L3A]|jgi:succinate dehydrogenase / fumarate reductase cytochrome b subunit|uniref:Succinate dehydrogenase cytochrome b556 subunit n=1 Tax=Salinisphaera shabanensis E1L3A TaxID=1033802 RepID=U2FQ51_9GAMM|nr:succinate dehydrogenase, cytochrome b556 subunit [Salinisphaera shabanensis]ERJ18269.1 Succinate dehydrogenase subunit C protein [Salinisphaera shabanensis E1L3A]